MKNQEKIKHLEKLLFKLKNSFITESTIKELSRLIRDEFNREKSSENGSILYVKNLNQTIEKYLVDLEKNADKPKVRIDLYNEFISNFKQDIDRELTDLKMR